MPKGTYGVSMIGPFMAVPPGTYEFSVDVAWSGYLDLDHPVAQLQLAADDEVLCTTELRGVASEGSGTLSCRASFPQLRFTVHVMLMSPGVAEITSPLSMTMSPDAWRRDGEPPLVP